MTEASPLLRRLADMVDGGRLAGARALLGAVKAQPGAPVTMADIEARLLLAEGRADAARSLLDGALAAHPAEPDLLARRAEARLHLGDAPGAAADAAEAVVLRPAAAAAKALLGVALLDLGRNEDAAACLAEAVRAQPLHAGYRRAFATAAERAGDAEGALDVLADGIRRAPADPALRTAAIMVRMRQRAFRAAADLAEQARRDGAVDACTLGLLGHALSSLGEHAGAGDAYREALKLAPEDPYVRHLVAASGAVHDGPRAPAAYLETVFDGYAARFEAHLIALGYRVPGLVRAALLEHCPPIAADGLPGLLDLGCGTGLVGVVLSDLKPGALTGVDLSRAMLDEAAAKGLYAELAQADIEPWLAAERRTWPVAVAADVFCYFGVLGAVFAALRPRLEPGGLLVFSAETLDPGEPGPWQLRRQGRYAHAPAHLRAALAAAGFTVEALREEVLRFEADAPVPGVLVVARRSHDA